MTILHLALFALFNILLGWLRGLGEGMTFVKPVDAGHREILWESRNLTWIETVTQFDLGVRGHRWMPIYHLITGLKDVMLVGLGTWLLTLRYEIWSLGGGLYTIYTVPLIELAPIVLLMGMVIWATYEFGYVYARYGKLYDATPEHVTFFDLFAFHAARWKMHLVRLVIILTLIGVMI